MTILNEMRNETTVPVVIADQEGFATRVSAPFEEALGRRAADIVGKQRSAIIPRELHDAHHMGDSRFPGTGTDTLPGQPPELEAMRDDGHALPAEHIIVAEQQGAQWAVAAPIGPLESE